MTKRIEITEEMREYMRLHFPTEPACDIADHFGISPGIISREARFMGLEKAPGWSVANYQGRYVRRRCAVR